MAVVKGTNSGFVTTAPTADPSGSSSNFDATTRVQKDTCPAGKTTITEVGVWLETGATNPQWSVGLYSHDSGGDTANALLQSTSKVAAGTGTGWRTYTVNWTVSPGTIYWIGAQCDNTTPGSPGNYTPDAGSRVGIRINAGWPDPFATQSDTANAWAIYALLESLPTDHEASGTADMTSGADAAAAMTYSGDATADAALTATAAAIVTYAAKGTSDAAFGATGRAIQTHEAAGSANAAFTVAAAGAIPLWDAVVTQNSWDLNPVRLGGLKVGDFDNCAEIANSGLLTFCGTAGLSHGFIYNDNVTIATALTLQNTWYRSYDASNAWQSGTSLNMTNGDGFIQVTQPGYYLALWSASIDFSSSPGAAQQIETGLMVDPDTGTYAVVSGGTAHRTLANSTDTGNAASFALLDLAKDYKVGIGFNNNTSAAKTLHNEHASLILIQISGT